MTMLGKHHSLETKKKLSKAISLTMTPERREQIRQTQMGRKQSKESNLKRSIKLKGRIFTKEHRLKLSQNNSMKGKYNEFNPNWRGDNISYTNLHRWVKRELGSPNQCERCKTTQAYRFEWANISHKYKRDLSDWIRLCQKCHRNYDLGKIKL